MSQANQSMRGDLSDIQNSIGLEVLLEGLGIIFMKSSDHSVNSPLHLQRYFWAKILRVRDDCTPKNCYMYFYIKVEKYLSQIGPCLFYIAWKHAVP